MRTTATWLPAYDNGWAQTDSPADKQIVLRKHYWIHVGPIEHHRLGHVGQRSHLPHLADGRFLGDRLFVQVDGFKLKKIKIGVLFKQFTVKKARR
jgi:hypothetical protein